MSETEGRRLLGRTIHELAQPCASAVLAVDTALELARRGASSDLVQRLEAAAEALAILQAKLRQAGSAAREATVHGDAGRTQNPAGC